MTLQEFSIEFDIMYNNISSNQAPGLTEYEKSIFLTQAQEALILDLYKGTTGDSFETTEEVTRYLNSLVKSETITEFTNSSNTYKYTISPKSTDIWFIVYQSAIIQTPDNRDVIVIPTTHDSILKELKNPFKGPNKNRILSITDNEGITLYSNYAINSFTIKYLSRPTPIILEDIDEGFTIESHSTETPIECGLPESLHTQILIRAVQIAKAVWA